MNTEENHSRSEDCGEKPQLSLGWNQSRWRLWSVRVVVFTVTFVLLMAAFSALGGIVEKFFVMLYSD